MHKKSKIYVAGHTGLVGTSVIKKLKEEGHNNLIYRTSAELDLRRQKPVEKFFGSERPDYVIMAAAKVGGIKANFEKPAEFIYDNLMIQSNIIHSAFKNKVKKLLFLGSSCIYPRLAHQPVKEEFILNGKLEPTNEAYAVAKISGLKMCQYYNKQYNTNFITVMPTNLYGPNDNFNIETSHVIPALIRKFYTAKVKNAGEVVVWGTGSPRREFLYIDDLADAVVFLMNNYSENDIINVGTGKDISILELAHILKEISGFGGDIRFDETKPDGTPRKLLDIKRISNMGWHAKTKLMDGLKHTYEWFVNNLK